MFLQGNLPLEFKEGGTLLGSEVPQDSSLSALMLFNNVDCLKNQKGLQVFTFKQLHFVTSGFGESNMVGHGRYPKRSAHAYAPLYAAFDWYVPPKTHVQDNDEVEFKISPGEITTAIKQTLMVIWTACYCRCVMFSVLADKPDALLFETTTPSLQRCNRDAFRIYTDFQVGRKSSRVEDKFIRNQLAKNLLRLLPRHSFGKCLNNVGGLDMTLFLYPKCVDNAHEASKWWDHLHYAMSHHKPLTFGDPLDLRPSAVAAVNANAPQIAPQNQSLMSQLATVFKSAYDSLGLETSGGKSANIQKSWYLMQTLMGNTSQIVTEHTIFDHKRRLVFNKSETPESDSTILTKEHFSEIQPVLHEISFDTLERTNSSEAPKATIVIPDSEPKKMEKVASGFIWNSASLGGNPVMT
ncbi:Alpha-(1,4)-fucosyltransferase [Vitis vinifera]|uniref:Alpha-(1,4)-fucosyltransferase n=1 Tax=Vitis vinifera TaxID=29760 RepID=A0A438DHB6_VITVI|nr:Alpha-(1,4)-fucosyltransferase [Vitis vinifera]